MIHWVTTALLLPHPMVIHDTHLMLPLTWETTTFLLPQMSQTIKQEVCVWGGADKENTISTN